MKSNFITNKGARASNQDVVLIENLYDDTILYLLADGMGGYKNGRYAADFIVKSLYSALKTVEKFSKNSIQAEVNKVTKALALENERQESKMGATIGGVIQSKDSLHCFWVGDVKIWHLTGGQIGFESVEHNLKNELIGNKVFVQANDAKKYNHVVTRAIQNDVKKAQIDYIKLSDFKQGDLIIIASDGVTDVLSNHQLLDIINSSQDIDSILSETDNQLRKLAKDNFSLIVINQNFKQL